MSMFNKKRMTRNKSINRHTGESRYPEYINVTGFRFKPGMTKKRILDFFLRYQDGSALIFIIVGITIAAVLGYGMFYMTSTSTSGQVSGNGTDRAYYLAMAGRDYALADWKPNNGNFIISNTELFNLNINNETIISTGIVNKDTPFEAKKVIGFKYVGSPYSPVKKHFKDSFDNLDNWDTDTQVGSHTTAPTDGDNALDMASSPDGFGVGSGTWGFLQLNTGGGGVGIDITPSWLNAGRCLSYDLQVKISNSEPLYMAGLNLKVAGSGNDREFYGISYLKTKQRKSWDGSWVQTDGIPSGVVPENVFIDLPTLEGIWPFNYQVRYSSPAIVLWKRQGGVFTWLAYKVLTDSDFVVDSSGNLVDWSNLQVRLIEGYPLDFTNGGPSPLLAGATITGETSGAYAIISGTPVLTSGSWTISDVAGTLALTNINGTFASGENLLVNGTALAKASGTQGTKTNFIRVYYGDANSVNPDTSDIIPTNNDRKRILRTEIHWPVDNMINWKAENDYMTLAQWDGVQAGAVLLGGIGGDAKEENAAIQDNSFLTPDAGAIDYSGIALHATGTSADSTYFDGFAVQY